MVAPPHLVIRRSRRIRAIIPIAVKLILFLYYCSDCVPVSGMFHAGFGGSGFFSIVPQEDS
jgi:hypothetical protein